MAAGILPAAADSRDLALDRMSRCYTLTDTRQYLECIYGAVQPLRNELGLATAPQAATFSALFARPAAPAPYVAAAPVAAPPLASAIRPEPNRGAVSSVFSTVMGIETRRVAPEQFGLRNARPGSGVNVDRITARLAEYSFDRGTNRFTVTLANGQVWRQRAGDEHSPNWKKAASSYSVTIGYGANSSFNLTVSGERQPYKVERVR
jgi:hypothetical protein